MNKRLTTLLLILFGAVLFLAHTTKSEVKLTATKVEFSGTVKLVWTKPVGANNTTQYELYRANLPDSAVKILTTSDTVFVDQVPPQFSSVQRTFAYRVTAKTGLNVELSNIVYVPVPTTPIIGSFRLEGKIDSGKVKLAWQKPPVGEVSYYLVYRGLLGDNSPTHIKIDSTTNQWSVTDAPHLNNPEHPMTFVFYVKAKLTTGEVLVSTTLQITIQSKPNRDDVKFVSMPNLYAQKDVKYNYTAKAVSNNQDAVIRYYAEFSSNVFALQFKIDSVSGVVDWTPTVKGMFQIRLIAKSNKGGSAKQEFTVTVAGGNGIIQGKVTDTLNIPIPNAIIEVFKSENNLAIAFGYMAKTDVNGNYRIARVDPGNYKLRANSPSSKYQSQWYDGKREASQADIVSVADSPAVSIANFKLRGGPMIAPKVTLYGTVTDTTNIAINNANTVVFFVRADFAFNLGGGVNAGVENFRKLFDLSPHGDFRLEGNSEFVFKANVDSLGKYSVLLPPGNYIAFAKAKGYAVEFYNEQSNILSSEIIRVPSIPTVVISYDFTLSPLPPVVLGGIKGSVSDSVKNIPIAARVIAFRDNWRFSDIHKISRVSVTDTDSLGDYEFKDLLPGKYVVLAVPLGSYAPSFYSNDTSAMRWKRATKIEVNGNIVDNINIYVKPLGPSANGYTGIAGNISVSGSQGSLRAGAIVYAYRNNEIAGYSFTNFEGNYFIGGLTPGQYSVFVDKPGLEESNSVSVNAGYDLTGSPVSGTANFTMNATTTSVGTTSSTRPTDYVLAQNYPNPFNPSTTIAFSLPNAGNVSLKVYNIIGQEVASLLSGYRNAGEYRVTFNASNLSSGVYLYRLESGSFTVMKKMMLVK